MSDILTLFDRLKGGNPEAEDKTKKNADAAVARSEQATGQKFQDEPGIEPDYTAEETAGIAFGGPAAGMARRAGGFAVRKGQTALMDKLKEEGPPNGIAPKPTFSEGVISGQTPKGPSAFSKWVKGEGTTAVGQAESNAASAPSANLPSESAAQGKSGADFNGLKKYGPTDTSSRMENIGFIEKLRQLRDRLYQSEGNSTRVKDITTQIKDMKVSSPLSQTSGETAATSGFKSSPGIYVNPKLK